MKRSMQPLRSRPAVPPIYQTSVFAFDSLEQVDQAFGGEAGAFVYSRYGNPSVQALEVTLAHLERTEAALVASSGMAALAIGVLSLCGQGDHIIAAQDLYGGTQALFQRDFSRWGIDVTFVDALNVSRVEDAIRPNTKLIFVETISNPLMKVADLSRLAAVKRGFGIPLMVDNTFASPVLCRPSEWGADLVMESLTKYLNGHSDVTAGAIMGSKGLIERMRSLHTDFGAVTSPFDAWLVQRSLQTLKLRMQQHCRNAVLLAEFLAAQPKVMKVHYPGLPGHPQHALAATQMSAYGGMLSFVVEGGCYGAAQVIKRLQRVDFVPSLGGTSTTVSHPAKTSHRGMTGMDRVRLGIDDGLIRVSAGLEDGDDISADFAQALAW
ncbi:MAG: L-methionine gamma-lyase [Firmicutes bacterium]|nr:L-methionine gamma-lyase [Bacillota bacterium]